MEGARSTANKENRRAVLEVIPSIQKIGDIKENGAHRIQMKGTSLCT